MSTECDAAAVPDISAAILAVLAERRTGGVMSLPRLARRLRLPASVALRQLALMGGAIIGGQAGPGWVQVVQAQGRWIVQLTRAGRRAADLAVAFPETAESASGT